MKKLSLVLFLGVVSFVFSGCLTVQFKEYKFHFDSKNSGTLTITFKNIFSMISEGDDADSTVDADYNDLVNNYLKDTGIEDDFPDAEVVSKKLYEDNGMLCGQIVLKFTDPKQVNLYKYDKKSPWMFSLKASETFYESNGTYPGDYMPVVLWKKNIKDDLVVTVNVSEPESTDLSLLTTWKNSQ